MFGIHCTEMGLQPTKNWAAVFALKAETFGVVISYLYPHHLQIFVRVVK
jgi:methylmalonyl-CoA mutase cobalamin-binding subunit